MLVPILNSKVDASMHNIIRKFIQKDPSIQAIIALAKVSKTRQFWIEEDLVFTRGKQLYVLRASDLRKILLHECHDTLWVGHPGWQQTYALLKKCYFWPNMARQCYAIYEDMPHLSIR